MKFCFIQVDFEGLRRESFQIFRVVLWRKEIRSLLLICLLQFKCYSWKRKGKKKGLFQFSIIFFIASVILEIAFKRNSSSKSPEFRQRRENWERRALSCPSSVYSTLLTPARPFVIIHHVSHRVLFILLYFYHRFYGFDETAKDAAAVPAVPADSADPADPADPAAPSTKRS